MPNLQYLYMKDVTWPSDRWPGYRDDMAWVVFFLCSGLPCYAARHEFLIRSWLRSRRVRETLLPIKWKPIPSSPSHLTLHLDRSKAALSWIMMPVPSEMLSKLSSLEIHSCFLNNSNDCLTEDFLKRLLASVPNIVHLTFFWHAVRILRNATNLFHPDLSLCTSLRTLDLRLMC
ncbi:hypothetical protein CPB85DRAFT_1311110, partial [Mucidula mucida]